MRKQRIEKRMSRQPELLQRAADCQRAIDTALDPREAIALGILRDMWTALARESSGLSESSLAMEIAAIEELQSVATRREKTGVRSTTRG
jgi:hypothetical protein